MTADETIGRVRAELERLFTAEERRRIGVLLGLEDAGDGDARALVARCLAHDRIDALVDVILHLRKEADPRLREVTRADAEIRLAGTSLGAFALERVLRESETGVAYLARRAGGTPGPGEGEPFLVTVLRPDATRDRRSVHRFLVANRLIAELQHPGLPHGVEAGESGGPADADADQDRTRFWVAYPLTPGETLEEWIARTGPTPFSELGPLLYAVLDALGALHHADLVHGNLAAENVLVGSDGQIVLTGFATDRLRIAGGAPRGVAPELVRGEAASPESDVYAFGALLYRLLTGRPPAESALALAAREPEPPSRHAPLGAISYEVDLLASALLHQDRSRRPHDAAAAREAVERALERDHALAIEREAEDELFASLRAEGKYEELVERLLARSDHAAAGPPRARALAAIGRVYAVDLEDPSQALIAFTQALCQDPERDAYALEVERLAGSDKAAWTEQLEAIDAALADMAAGPAERALRLRAARWQADRLGRADAARAAYERILAAEPGNEAAADAITSLDVRRAEEAGDFGALADALRRRARAQSGPARIETLAKLAELEASRLHGAAEATRAFDEAVVEETRRREAAGDADAVLGAIAKMAPRAPSAGARAELWSRAATRLEARGDVAGAIEHWEHALAATPADVAMLAALRKLREGRGEWPEATALLERELDAAVDDAARARLGGKLARILHRELGDPSRAEAAAKRALAASAEEPTAQLVLGDLAFEAGRLADAAAMYGWLLARSHGDGGVSPEERPRVLERAGKALFAAGDPSSSQAVHRELLAVRGAELPPREKAELYYRLGESARRAGNVAAAVEALRASIDLDPAGGLALEALASALVVLGDRDAAVESLAAALEQRPDDRNLLTRLMQLYSEQGAWEKVCEVVLRLAGFVGEPKQRAKYMATAAAVVAEALHDVPRALGYYRAALEFDPTLHKARAEAISLAEAQGDWAEVERLLKGELEVAKADAATSRIVLALDRLGAIYKGQLGDPDLAIDALEAAEAFAEDPTRAAVLADLYAADPKQHLAEALALHQRLLREDPYRIERYRALQRLYAGAGRADEAWCHCQALAVLRQADEAESALYRKYRSETAAPVTAPLDDAAWARLLHRDLDPLLTHLFAMIEPTVVRTRTRPIEDFGYDPRVTIDCSLHPSAVAQTLYYAQGVLAMPPPLVFEDEADPAILGILHSRPPAMVIGRGASDRTIANQAMAFYAGRDVTAYRPGFYVRQLVPTGTGLKAWLFAAIQLTDPHLVAPADVAGQVEDDLAAMADDFGGGEKDLLASAVGKLRKAGGALDLKKWMAAVDLTADRVGLLLAHDLQIATEAIRSTEKESSVPVKDRMREIVLFSVSEEYFALRRKLGIAVSSERA